MFPNRFGYVQSEVLRRCLVVLWVSAWIFFRIPSLFMLCRIYSEHSWCVDQAGKLACFSNYLIPWKRSDSFHLHFFVTLLIQKHCHFYLTLFTLTPEITCEFYFIFFLMYLYFQGFFFSQIFRDLGVS